MRLPFSLMPKKREKHTGPRYGDVYPRAVAAAIDLAALFLILNDFFLYTRQQILSGVDRVILYREQTEAGSQTLHMLNNLADSGFLKLLLLSATMEILMIGVVIISVQWIWGTTPGKWLIGLKIVRAKTLEPVSKWQYPVRYFAYIPSVLPLMLGIFWAYFNKERRGWHDFIAGTTVINVRPDGWYWGHVKRAYYKLRGKTPPVATASAPETVQNID